MELLQKGKHMKNKGHHSADGGQKKREDGKTPSGGARIRMPGRGRGKKPIHHRRNQHHRIACPIYGLHAARAAWLNSSRQIHALYVSEAGLKSFEEVLREGIALGLGRPDPVLIEKEGLEKILPAGAVHQGVALSCAPLVERSVGDLLREVDAIPHGGRCVILMLDQVTDPHNVGAILRSASAFGAQGVVMQRKYAPELSGVLAKIATGAVEYMPVAQETNLSRALEDLKAAQYFVIGMDEHESNKMSHVIKDTQNYEKIVLVLGSEGKGIRRLVRENCDVIASLPTQGAIQSLNVSNAATVGLFALLNHST